MRSKDVIWVNSLGRFQGIGAKSAETEANYGNAELIVVATGRYELS